MNWRIERLDSHESVQRWAAQMNARAPATFELWLRDEHQAQLVRQGEPLALYQHAMGDAQRHAGRYVYGLIARSSAGDALAFVMHFIDPANPTLEQVLASCATGLAKIEESLAGRVAALAFATVADDDAQNRRDKAQSLRASWLADWWRQPR